MKQNEFLNTIRKIYIGARNCKFVPREFPDILKRGTSHSISSETEDLFGCYCAEKVTNPDNIKILIDPQISFKGTELTNKSGKRPLLIRPDIAFINNGLANCFFDLKTDLGYKRFGLLDQAKEKSKLIKKIKKMPAIYKDGRTKTEFKITISENVKFIYVVISSGNISNGKLEEYINGINKLKNVEIYVLSKGEHLNSYREKPKWELYKDDFNELDEILINRLKKTM